MESPYEYVSLPDSSKHIRILSLAPSKVPCAELQASLDVKLLATKTTKYEGLSYTWGSDTAPEYLSLDGRRFRIGTNLREALGRLRLPYRTRYLWIDAICINQRDDMEKSDQIKLMGKIYSHAWRTLIWLGEDSKENDGKISCEFFAMAARSVRRVEHLEGFHTNMRSLQHQATKCVSRVKRPLYSSSSLSVLLKAERKKDGKSLALVKLQDLLAQGGREHALKLFLDRPWFGRRWIIQETCLAQKAVMICGEHDITWTAFYKVLEVSRNESNSHHRAYTLFNLFWQFTKNLGGHPNRPESFCAIGEIFMRNMGRLDKFECKDPRDRIGALLGMWDSLSDHITVDYRRSAEDNYKSFARTLILKGLCVSVLEAAAERPRLLDDEPDALPSWVPDWRLPVIARLNRNEVSPTVDNPYRLNRSDDFDPTLRPPMCSFRTLDNGQEALIVHGKIIDRILRVLPETGWLNWNSSDCYAANATYGHASNLDRKALGGYEYDLAWPRDSSRLHLVRRTDLICSITADESFMTKRAQKRIMFGLIVLRKLSECKLRECNIDGPAYTLVATFEQYEPKNPLRAREALDPAKFEDIMIL